MKVVCLSCMGVASLVSLACPHSSRTLNTIINIASCQPQHEDKNPTVSYYEWFGTSQHRSTFDSPPTEFRLMGKQGFCEDGLLRKGKLSMQPHFKLPLYQVHSLHSPTRIQSHTC
ncbi:hypothetical protein AGOR_G00102000 [Albula goreensis]|uniref:Secreted protein n=1 Tax=Albula goreensis TaxID=1534307 RepID=A0A8T3DCQ3_9TELE|nr:hypothetical protein AGOR_G00102000 [Albula goreensis]